MRRIYSTQKVTAPISSVLAVSSLRAHFHSTQFLNMSSASCTLFPESMSDLVNPQLSDAAFVSLLARKCFTNLQVVICNRQMLAKYQFKTDKVQRFPGVTNYSSTTQQRRQFPFSLSCIICSKILRMLSHEQTVRCEPCTN